MREKRRSGARHHCFAIDRCEREVTQASGEENEQGESKVMAVKGFFVQIWWCGGLGCYFCGVERGKKSSDGMRLR